MGSEGTSGASSHGILEVRISVPDAAVGQAIADALVADRLAACVQVLAPMTSTYVWDGQVQHDTEQLLLAKTTAARFAALAQRVVALHPYDEPEVIAVPVTHATDSYADWVVDSVTG